MGVPIFHMEIHSLIASLRLHWSASPRPSSPFSKRNHSMLKSETYECRSHIFKDTKRPSRLIFLKSHQDELIQFIDHSDMSLFYGMNA